MTAQGSRKEEEYWDSEDEYWDSWQRRCAGRDQCLETQQYL